MLRAPVLKVSGPHFQDCENSPVKRDCAASSALSLAPTDCNWGWHRRWNTRRSKVVTTLESPIRDGLDQGREATIERQFGLANLP
jgi:hypothetical protein